MATEYSNLSDALISAAARLPVPKRSLFLLGYAQRLTEVFALFERRANRIGQFQSVLEEIWKLAEGVKSTRPIDSELESLIPGEERVVDGFYDAVAQYVGGLAAGALEGLSGSEIDRRPEAGVFDLIRLFLSEMRLGCTEPGEDKTALKFDAGIHTDTLAVAEVSFWRELLRRIGEGEASASEARQFAVENQLDPAVLEPALSAGLERDDESARQWKENQSIRT